MTTIVPDAGKMTSRKRLKKIAWRLVRSLVIAYLLVLLVMAFFQTYLIFPGTFRQGKDDTRIVPADGETLLTLKTPDGVSLAALFGEADLRHMPELRNAPRPAVLLFYGNGDAMTGARSLAETFRSMGYHCMLIDYPGYGMSDGKPSEQGCYAAAEAAYQYLLSRPDVDRSRLVAAGWSLGGGVAIDLVHRHRTDPDSPFCGLITFCSFTSIVDVAKTRYPFLPVSLIVQHRFSSAEKISDLSLPYFNAHGRRDDFIPISQADALVQAYGGSSGGVRRFVCEAASHNDFFDHEISRLHDALKDFLTDATR